MRYLEVQVNDIIVKIPLIGVLQKGPYGPENEYINTFKYWDIIFMLVTVI